jgi:hypothetical protein
MVYERITVGKNLQAQNQASEEEVMIEDTTSNIRQQFTRRMEGGWTKKEIGNH